MTQLKDHALLRTRCYINGQWLDADSGRTIAVSNPATGETIGSVPDMGAAEAERAVAAAQAALPAWRALTAKQRSQILRRWFDLMMESQEELATLLTLEQGKPLAESRSEIAYGASYIEWYAEEAKRVYGDTIPGPAPDKRIVVLKQPIGVCAAITPWNFPNAMITRKAAPALAAGCTFVIRPASQTPFSALAIAALAERAGIPAGVFNVITGSSREIGRVFTESDTVKKFSFTGSTAVGRQLQAQCASTIKKTSMELGGNAPFIVFDDADLDAAVSGAIACKFRNAGQTCVCANRIYVQSGVYDEFVRKFAQAAGYLKVGNGLEIGTECGPLIDEAALAKVEEHLADALAHGGEVVAPHPCRHESSARRNLRPARPRVPFRERSRRVATGQRHRIRPGRLLLHPQPRHGHAHNGRLGIRHGRHQHRRDFQRSRPLRRRGGKYGLEEYLETKYVMLSV